MSNELTVFEQLAHSAISDGYCIEWEGSLNRQGYGISREFNGEMQAHRIAAIIGFQVDRLPPGTMVAHICDNKRCINPYHLRVVTFRENIQDRFAKNGSLNCKKLEDTLTWNDNYWMLQGWKYYTQISGESVGTTKHKVHAADYRNLSLDQKRGMIGMSSGDIMEKYGIPRRTAQGWKQYVQAEFGDGDQK